MATAHDHKDQDRDKTYEEFKDLVNMTASTLEKWLETDESQEVGWKGEDGQGSGESVGHKSGERVVEILHKKKADLSEADVKHMAKVVGYIRRHSAQKPESDDLAHTRWTYSLKNWGHDPTKKS